MCFIDHDEEPGEMDDTKGVFAHFMVGNTYPYVLRDWSEDIELALLHHLDGFVLNIGSEDWQKDRVADCFQATEAPGLSSFKLFFSFDMSVIPCKTQGDIQHLLEYIKRWGNHPSMYRRDGKVVVSTFAGESSLFGFGDMETAWDFLKKCLGETICFMPSFFIDPARYDRLHFMDGVFNWIYRGDDWLFVRRWNQLIAARDRIDIVQIISWNDYGESHYIGPIKGAQPNSQAWVDGFDHLPWLKLSGYFARAFKEGVYPSIEEDQIYMWARPHPKDAEAADDNVPRPRNWELTDDTFWVVVLAKAPGMLVLSVGEEGSRTIQVTAGVNQASHSLEPCKGMEARLYRGGDLIVACKPSEFSFDPHPPVYNFNAFVATS
ncbi:hypothetical protein EYR40_007164 [Pleurotus pulmonarius]|nr:hypothetical protein EYR40_007164 [Pleurotus pulmonarius]